VHTRNKIKDARPRGRWSSSADYLTLQLTRYVPIVCILAAHLSHEDMWCVTSRELASKHEPKEMTKATLALSLLLSSELILSTRAGTADTEETAWSALGLDCLCVRNLFLRHPPSLRNMFHGLRFSPYGVSQVHLSWKDCRCLNGLVLLFSVREYSIDNGVRIRKWPNGITVVPTRCCTSWRWRVGCIAFFMFSPTRICARSCSHGFLFDVWD